VRNEASRTERQIRWCMKQSAKVTLLYSYR